MRNAARWHEQQLELARCTRALRPRSVANVRPPRSSTTLRLPDTRRGPVAYGVGHFLVDRPAEHDRQSRGTLIRRRTDAVA